MTESTKPRTIIEAVILAALAGGGGFQYYDNGQEVAALQSEIGAAYDDLDAADERLDELTKDISICEGQLAACGETNQELEDDLRECVKDLEDMR